MDRPLTVFEALSARRGELGRRRVLDREIESSEPMSLVGQAYADARHELEALGGPLEEIEELELSLIDLGLLALEVWTNSLTVEGWNDYAAGAMDDRGGDDGVG